MDHRAVMRALALALLTACAPQATLRDLVDIDRTDDAIVIKNATVFTATSRERLVGFDVVIADGAVAAIEPTGTRVPRGARVIDGTGRTLLPGLVDAHVHVANPGAVPWRFVTVPPEHNLEAYLYSGITTVYDLGGPADDLEKLQHELALGHVDGPRLYHTGFPITAPGSHPIPLSERLLPWPVRMLVSLVIPQARGPADAPGLVDDAVRHGADYIKIARDQIPAGTPELDAATMKALVDAAHAAHRKVFVHVGSVDDSLVAARAGADVLAHGVYRGQVTAEDARALADTGVKVIFTLASFHHVADLAHERWQPTALDEETTAPELLEPLEGSQAALFNEAFGDLTSVTAAYEGAWAENVKLMFDAGITIIPASDSVIPGVWAGGTLHEDMRWLVAAGVPTVDVLLGATARAARLFLEDPPFGTIEVGKPADLLLVDGDPFADIDATTHIAAVIRAGHVVVRHTP